MSSSRRHPLTVVALLGLLSAAAGAPSQRVNAQHFRADDNQQLGIEDLDADVIFTPLTPCRVIDTRLAGGAFVASETRNYDLIGPSNYTSIGGNAAGCGIPATFIGGSGTTYGNRVRALVLNIVAVFPTGNGNLRAWPTNQAIPLAAVLNYAPALYAVANGLAIRTCDAMVTSGTPCLAGDLSIRADTAGADVVVDVLGYYAPTSYVLASNRTLRGTFAVGFTATAAGQGGFSAISFHPPLAVQPGTNIIAPGGAATLNCPGTAINPTAAPGQLCLYQTAAANLGAGTCIARASTMVCSSSDPYGVLFFASSAAVGPTVATGVWAVTAP